MERERFAEQAEAPAKLQTAKDPVFRLMEEADAASASALEKKSSAEAWSEKSYRDAVRDANALYVVAQSGERIVGCCGLWISFEEADVCNVVVDSDFRRKGIAERMLCFLMEKGKEAGVSNFTLEVRTGNEGAIRLYEKLGFVTEGVRKGFYDNPKEDALIMWKR